MSYVLLVIILLTSRWYLIPSEAARPLGLGPADKLSNQISLAKQTRDINKLSHSVASFPGRSRLQVFDHILKTEGEGLGERGMCVTSGRREGRREGGGDRSL